MDTSYIPLVVMLVVGFSVAGIFLLLSKYIGARRSTPDKQLTYESGLIPFGSARKRFSVKFYMTAMSFIIFDVEALFLYPWAVNLSHSKSAAMFWCGILFIVILLVGYFWELKKGGFEWD